MPPPPSLHELQRAFAAGLVQGDALALTPWIAARGIDPQARLRIYRHAGYAIHIEALEAVFPAVRALIGDESFDGLATRYTARRGSASGNLQHFGSDFAAFVHAQPEMAAYPWLEDVAALEWLRQESLLAADCPVPETGALLAALQAAPADALHVRLQPHVRVLQAQVPALDLWSWALEPEQPASDPAGPAQCVLLWRYATRIEMQAVDADTAHFLGALQQGRDLASALRDTTDPDRLAIYLSPLIEQSLMVSITDDPATTKELCP